MKTLIIVTHPHIEELLHPFELTFEYIPADERLFFAYYGIELNRIDREKSTVYKGKIVIINP